jgi:hypothetical protein
MGPTITDWIAAVVGVLTLAAAVAAGVYARRAAHWTKAQAHAADKQVRLARTALGVAQQEAMDARRANDHQRKEARIAARRLAEARVDARMPTLLARATPGTNDGTFRDVLEIGRRDDSSPGKWTWAPVDSQLELPGDEEVLFRTNITMHLANFSTQIAQVAIIDPAQGEVSVRSGDSVLVPPHDERVFTWSRILPMAALRTEEGINLPEHSLLNMKIWIRDLGLNAHDVVQFNADLRFFTRDGSRLIVKTEPPYPWRENIGQPLPERVYERLDAASNATEA